MDCLFCKIVAGEIPSAKVYEDEKVFAFRDIAPQAPKHVLIVPKKHMSNILECDGETAAALVKGSKSLVRIEVLPYQRAAGAKYEMVSMAYNPGFDESKSPEFFTQVFEREGIPFLCLR